MTRPEHREAKTIRKKAMRSHTLAAYRVIAESLIHVLAKNNLKKIKKTIPFKTRYEQIKNSSIKFNQ